MSQAPTRDASVERPLSAIGANSLLAPPNAQFGTRSPSSRRPLRSSPLAGPVVISLNDNDGEIAVIPRVASTPSLANNPELLSPAALHPRSRSSQSLSRPTSMISVYSDNSLTPPLEAVMRRRSAVEPKGVWSPSAVPASSLLEVPSPVSPRARPRSRSPNLQDPSTRYSYTSSPPTSPIPGSSASGRRPISTVLEGEEANPSASTHSLRAPTSPRDNSWYISNPYSETPKFSRLGLSGNGVVMPVSVKSHQRKHQRTPSGSELPHDAEPTLERSKSLKKRMSSLSSAWSLKKLVSDEAASIPPVPPLPTRSKSAVDVPSMTHLSPLTPPPPIHSRSVSSSPSNSPKTSFSDLGSTLSLPLSTPYSSNSVASSSRTSVADDTTPTSPHHPPGFPPTDSDPHGRRSKSKIFSITPEMSKRRKSVVSRMKSWRTSTAPPVPPIPAEFVAAARMNTRSADEPRKPRQAVVLPPPAASVHDLRTVDKHSSLTVQITHVTVKNTNSGSKDSTGPNHTGMRRNGTIRRIFKVFVGNAAT